MLTLGKNLCICPRGRGGQPPPWVPTALCAAVHSVRYQFVHSSAPNGPCAAIQNSENCEHLCSAAHYGDSDHFPVGTLHPLFNLDNFSTQNYCFNFILGLVSLPLAPTFVFGDLIFGSRSHILHISPYLCLEPNQVYCSVRVL